MSSPSDLFDDGQQWQDVHSNSAWTTRPTVLDPPYPPQSSSSSSSAAAATGSSARSPQLIPSVPVLTHHGQPSAPAPASSSSSAAPTAVPTTNTTHSKSPAAPFDEDLPPSYEATVVHRGIPQIHDNYDHLRGPPGQRGVDLKTRIPLDSTPAEYYQSGGGGSSSNAGGGSGSRTYGSITNQPSFSSTLAQPSAPQLLQNQTAASGQVQDDAAYARDVDRLLGPNNTSTSQHEPAYPETEEDDEPESHWTVVGDGKAWMSLVYSIIVLLPWSLFCFIWTLITLIISLVTMIIPPIGYLFVVATVTSWRALARVDLEISKLMVSRADQEKHPYRTASVFLSFSSSSSSSPLHSHSHTHSNGSITTTTETIINGQRVLVAPRRRHKNLWDKSAAHLKDTLSNRYSLKSLSYFLIWKVLFAIPVFAFVIVFAVLTIPFMFCLLPSLLHICRVFARWQFRWAILWVAEKPAPIALQ
ncbi:hypothetical protein BGZ83_006547 [Gryganskiella cystojenkinii]|nr:hypothetical protein BGZ83_006547 [Gryganskiella cystojenkinii]